MSMSKGIFSCRLAKLITKPQIRNPLLILSDSDLWAIVKNSIWIFTIMLGGYFMEWLTRVIIARKMGVEAFGFINFGLSLNSIGMGIACIGIPTVIMQEITKYLPIRDWSRIKSTMLSGVVLLIATSSIVSIIIFVIYRFRFINSHPIVLYFIACIPFAVFMRLAADCFRGLMQSQNAIATQELLMRGSRLLFVGIAAYYIGDLNLVAAAYLISFTVSCIVPWIVLIYFLSRQEPQAAVRSPFCMRRILLVALPLGGSFIFIYAIGKIETVLLGILSTGTNVGIYSSSLSIAQLLLLPTAAITFMFLPKITSYATQGRHSELRMLLLRTIFLIFICDLVLSIPFIISSRTMINWVFGREFEGGDETLKLLTVAYSIYTCFIPFGYVLMSRKQNKRYFIGSIVGTLIVICGSIILIPFYGINGAAIGNLLGLSCMAFLFYYFSIHMSVDKVEAGK